MKCVSIKAIVAMAVLLIFALPGYAQESITVGEILAKGGKKLTKEEVVAKYSVTVYSEGVLAVNPNRKSELTHIPDGSFKGVTSDLRGSNAYRIEGKYSINELGQLCVAQVRNSLGQDVTPNSRCTFLFVHGDAQYSATSDSPDATAYRRLYKK